MYVGMYICVKEQEYFLISVILFNSMFIIFMILPDVI